MAKRKYPVTLEHSKLQGTTTANSDEKLARYKAKGWKVKDDSSSKKTSASTGS